MSDPRRKTKRYKARWKAALAFDRSTNRPIVHTVTRDLSMSGTSVQNQTDEAINSLLTLLLVPRATDGAPQKILKLKAAVMSSTAFRNGFRLGLSFIPDDELSKLRAFLERLDLSAESLPSEPDETESNKEVLPAAAPAHGSDDAATPAMSILDVLKQKNLAKKLAEEQLAKDKLERQRVLSMRISSTLMSAYRYFTDLVEQLNSLKPAYPRPYPLLSGIDLSDLVWQDNARTNCFTRKLESEDKIFNKVTLEYSFANPKEIQVVRDSHLLEKTKRTLDEEGIPYQMTRSKNDRGHVDKVNFFIPCEVKAGLVFTCNDESGTLLLRTINVERFGIMEYEFDIERLDQTLLDQLTLMILGEKHSVGKLIKPPVPRQS